MSSFNYEERSLYGMLFADLAVYLPYLFLSRYNNSLARIAGAMLLLMLVHILAQILIAIGTRNRVKDERDQLIQLYGYRAGYIAFMGLVGTGLSLFWLSAAVGRMRGEGTAELFLGALFGMIVVADIVRIVTQLISYRREA